MKNLINIISAVIFVLIMTPAAFAGDRAIGSLAGEESDWQFRSGARIGYVYAHNSHQPNPKTGEESPLQSPHMFSIGFEMQQVLDGGSWLDLIMIEGVSLTGLDQSVAAPSARILMGFEINNTIQIAVGPNISAHDPSGDGNILHLIGAIGVSLQAGKFTVPFHVAFMPDKNKYNVFALTTGINW